MGIFLKKGIAISAAIIISTMSISTVNAEETVVKGNINKPYANFTVQGDGAENLGYTLTNSKGEKVAGWKGLYNGVDITAQNVYKIAKYEPRYFLINNKKLYNYYDNSDMFKDINDNSFINYSYSTDDGRTMGLPNNPITNLELGKINTLTLKKYNLPTKTEFTIPAGKYQFFADQGVLNKKYNVGVSLTARDADNEYDVHYFNAAKSGLYDLPAQYSFERLFIEGSHTWVTNITNNYVRKYDEDVSYAKVKVKLGDLDKGITADGKLINKNDSNIKYDLRETSGEHYRALFVIMSGGAIQAVTPDKDGYVEFYVNTKDYYVGYHYKVYDKDIGNTTVDIVGYTMDKDKFLPIETLSKKVDTNLDIPYDGITLYNLEPDTYTVSIDNDEYTLENDTFTVNDTADLQKFTLNLATKSVSSEDDNSSDDESSSSIDSSSEEESSSNADSSSELESSSSIDSSSESEESSNTDSSSKSEDNSNKKSNTSSKNDKSPVTGAAAGISISATVLAAAALIVSKKRK